MLHSDFFYENMEEYAHIHGRKPEFYIDKSRDYLIEEVRNEFYDFIAETLSKYDLYGIVIDFQREFNCFPPGREDEGRTVIFNKCFKI